MIDERFIILAVIIGTYGSISYSIDTIKGKVKPNRVTWFLWALAPLIAFAAEIKQGVGLHSLMTFAVGFGPLMILLASFLNKKAYWKLSKLDYICGGFSILALVLWSVTKNGNIAIMFAILADGIAAVPTLVKAWKAPETENYLPFMMAIITSTTTLLAIKVWDFAHYAFPIYIFTICLIFVLLIKFKFGKLFSKKELATVPEKS